MNRVPRSPSCPLVGSHLGNHGSDGEQGGDWRRGHSQAWQQARYHLGTFSVYPPSFVTTHCALQFSSRGIRPGLTTVLARNLDKNTVGYLQWRWGVQSAMNTSIVRDLLRVSWTSRRSNQFILKEISPEYSLERLMLKLKLLYFGHLMGKTDSLEKTLMLGKIEGGRRGRQRMRR